MNTIERRARDDKIEGLFLTGLSPVAIGVRFGLKACRIRTVLAERGFPFFNPTGDGDSIKREDNVWSRSGDDRRRAFWERAKRAAASALRQGAA